MAVPLGRSWRETRLVALLGALGLVAVACGGGGGGSGGETESAGETDPGASDSADDTSGADDDTGGTGTDGELDVHPPPGGVRRLLAHQYVATIRYLLGDAAAAAAEPPEDPQVGHFDAMATLVSVPAPADVEGYEGSSTAIALATVANPGRLGKFAPCVVDGPFKNGCYEHVAEDFGRLAWRRPLTGAEVRRFKNLAIDAKQFHDGDFWAGLRFELMAILQSPNFLYIVEIGDEPEQDGDARVLNGYEVATRVAFFLTGRTPSKGALQMAEDGLLDTEDGVRALASELLNDDLARETTGRFFGELLTVRDVPTKGKDPELFPGFTDELKDAMLQETMRLVEDIVFDQDAPITELFDADYTFVNDDLAFLYGVPEPGGGWDMVSLPPEQRRAGVLTHASWLSMQAHTDVNSPTRRGLFVMEQLLCEEIPLPPPDVNPEPIVPVEGQTLREALSQHMNDPACNACHGAMDPIGFAFEHFNAMGAFRKRDNGKKIDASGDVEGLGSFDRADDLAALVAADPRLTRCLVDKSFSQGLGWVPKKDQKPALDAVGTAYDDQGQQMRGLLIELMASPVFRRVDEPK